VIESILATALQDRNRFRSASGRHGPAGA